jgi:hypothetical protein
MARSIQTLSEYIENSRDNEAAGRRLIYLNSYMHSGSPRFSAIWSSSAPAHVHSVTMLGAREFQFSVSERTSAGWEIQAVTAVEQGGSARYSAFWYQ